MDDRELLARLAGGEEEAQAAFDEIFRAWYARLVRLAESIVHERAVAEELAQDVLLELWRRRERLAVDGAPHAYLLQATRNRAFNHLRHRRVVDRGAVHLATDEAREATAADELVGAELETAVRQAIAELPPRCREVFELSRVRGLRYSEIAETLGVSVKTVEANMGRALKSLRERLAGWLPRGGEL